MNGIWQRYYAAAATTPRDTLLDALARFDAEGRPPGTAVDLGCGAGRDTLELLRRGWRVVAVDAEPQAFELLEAAVDPEVRDRLETVLSPFEDASLPTVDLVNASFALPFVPPAGFRRTWARILSSLRPGGRFSGHLFGEHDQWAPAPDMTFFTHASVEALLEGFDVERLIEQDEPGRTATGGTKHWHLFSIVARRR